MTKAEEHYRTETREIEEQVRDGVMLTLTNEEALAIRGVIGSTGGGIVDELKLNDVWLALTGIYGHHGPHDYHITRKGEEF